MRSRSRRTILAALALLAPLTACTEGSGDALEGGVDVPTMCQAWCQQHKDCFSDQFDADFGSMEGCRAACEQDAGEFYDGYQPPECIDEALTKDICVASLSCAQLEAVDYSSCEDELLALDQCLGYLDGGV
jgi:hypothetical protein